MQEKKAVMQFSQTIDGRCKSKAHEELGKHDRSSQGHSKIMAGYKILIFFLHTQWVAKELNDHPLGVGVLVAMF